MMPSVFRDGKHELNEDRMFYDIINKKPEEFANCRCAFDHLVKMQHYGIPTRLLDITSNPLIALYFACYNAKKIMKPIVYYINFPEDKIKNYTSNIVTISSNFCTCKKEDKFHIIRQLFFPDIILRFIKDLYYNDRNSFFIEEKNIPDIEEQIAKYEKEKWGLNDLYNDNTLISDFIESNKDEINTCIKEQKDEPKEVVIDKIKDILYNLYIKNKTEKLICQIRQDKPYFKDSIKIKDFSDVFLVRPKMNNYRVTKQSGAFLIFPHKEIIWDRFGINKIRINTKHIKSIMEELDALNINKESLFNDMDTVCNSIREKYKTKEDDER